MATRSEEFHAKAQRNANPPKKKSPRRPRRDTPIDTALPGISTTDRRAGVGDTAKRNVSKRVANKGGANLESSTTDTPSRKSTRKASGRVKRTTNLQLRQTQCVSSPKFKGRRAKVAKGK